MRASKKLIAAMTLALLGIFALNANGVFALTDTQRIKQIKKIVEGKAAKEKLMNGRFQIKQTAGGPKIYGQATTFPLVIDQPGSYVLTSDINVSATSVNAIEIEADDVTLDLNGFSIIGPGSGAGYAIYTTAGAIKKNVEICNGTVRSFDFGILDSSGANHGFRIVDVQAVSNLRSGIYIIGAGHLIKDCTALYNGENGIHASSGCTITGNTVYNNGENGIDAGVSCLVIGNTAYNNNYSSDSTSGGIRVSLACLVKDNVLRSNGVNNIYIWNTNNAIEENLVIDSTNGINFGGSDGTGTTGNFYANNRASEHTTNYANTTGNTNGGGNVSF